MCVPPSTAIVPAVQVPEPTPCNERASSPRSGSRRGTLAATASHPESARSTWDGKRDAELCQSCRLKVWKFLNAGTPTRITGGLSSRIRLPGAQGARDRKSRSNWPGNRRGFPPLCLGPRKGPVPGFELRIVPELLQHGHPRGDRAGCGNLQRAGAESLRDREHEPRVAHCLGQGAPVAGQNRDAVGQSRKGPTTLPGRPKVTGPFRFVIHYVCRDRADQLWQFGRRSNPACRPRPTGCGGACS